MRAVALALLVPIAGCLFSVAPLDPDTDALNPEAADEGLAGEPDAAMPPAPKPDLAMLPFVPSHLPGGAKGTLDVSPQAAIDTSALTVDGQPLPGAFTDVGGLAVLSVHDLSIAGGAVVRAVGTRPLVIVASGAITIAGTLDGGAHHDEPGPGGAPSGMGPGAGHPGDGSPADCGGSGGGYGAPGGGAGGASGLFCLTTSANPPGTASGDPHLAMLAGGSGGGAGSAGTGCRAGSLAGGAGGGAIQLSAAGSIRVSGHVTVGGGGGRGGCLTWLVDSGSGGGGGSGGAIEVESPTVDLTGGVLAANGGAGGGGAFYSAGGDGADGLPGATAAAGGAGGGGGGGEVVEQRGGAGGTGGAGAPSSDVGNCGNSGGGGGGAGRILLRGHGAPVLTGATVSPAPTIAPL